MRSLHRPCSVPAAFFRHGGRRLLGKNPALDFSININPLGPPHHVLDALRAGLEDLACYPDSECTALTVRLAAHHNVDPEQIVIGNGSTELIYAIARACRPRRVAIAEPTFTEYLRASLLVGAVVEHWLAEGGQFDLEPFRPEEAELVWLCNLNNPTGRLWPAGTLRRWIENHGGTLFVVYEGLADWLTAHCDLRPVAQALGPAWSE